MERHVAHGNVVVSAEPESKININGVVIYGDDDGLNAHAEGSIENVENWWIPASYHGNFHVSTRSVPYIHLSVSARTDKEARAYLEECRTAKRVLPSTRVRLRTVEVHPPADVDLLIDTITGSIDVASHIGTLWIETVSGPVSVRSVTGDVTIDTTSGSVSIQDVVGRCTVRTSCGSVYARNVVGGGSVVSASGCIQTTACDLACVSTSTRCRC